MPEKTMEAQNKFNNFSGQKLINYITTLLESST
jgi:hypothetical protein